MNNLVRYLAGFLILSLCIYLISMVTPFVLTTIVTIIVWLIAEFLPECLSVAATIALPLIGLGLAIAGLQRWQLGFVPSVGPRWFDHLAIAWAIWVIVPHIVMTLCLIPLKSQFHDIARGGGAYVNRGYQSIFDDRPYVSMEFSGQLDKLVADRNKILWTWGYVGFGSWHTSTRGTSTTMTYLWIGPWFTWPLLKGS